MTQTLPAVQDAWAQQPITTPPAVRDPDEYAVWSVVLTNKYVTGSVKELVIADRTIILKSDFVAKHLRSFENATDTVSDLLDKNQVQYAVENKFAVNVPCTIWSKETANALFHLPANHGLDPEAVKNMNDGWHQFHKEHPDTGGGGIIGMSRVGFNADKTQAVVYIATSASPMIANGKCFLLTKKNGSWEIEREDLIWFS